MTSRSTSTAASFSRCWAARVAASPPFGLFRQIGALGRELRGSRGRHLVIAVPMLWLLAFFLAPLLVVLQISLAQRTGGVPPYSELVAIGEQGLVQITLSLAGYLRLLSDPLYVESYLSSLQFASVSTLACLLIGWPEGRGIDTIAIAHVTLCVCYVTVVVRSRLVQGDQSLEEAAMDLGARPWKVFFLVTLPLIWPALLAGWLLAFTLSLDDVVIASFTSGPGSTTLPVLILSKVRFGVTPEINALATLVIVAVCIGVSVAGWMMHRQQSTQR